MSTSDLFKYLDPTTLGDSSFLSFSSFADLTQSTFDEEYSQFTSSFGQVCDSIQDDKRSHTPYQSSPTPPFSCSDVGSDFEFSQNPFSLLASNAISPVTPTLCTGDFGIFHTPSRAGPSKLSGPGQQPIHHVSQRSTSSSSDWNSPVTPSLTYKSSVDSLATLAPEHDFYLSPPSNTGYGWDDQAYGASSSSYSHSVQNSPPSPSPYRVTSNPTLNTNRHHRAIKQITSMPALKEEDQSTAWFDQFINDDTTKVDEGLAENFDWTFPEFGLGTAGEMGTEGTIFEAFQEMETKQEPPASIFEDLSTAQFSDPSSSTTVSYSQVDVEAPSIVPDLSFSSVDDNSEFMQEFNQWQNDNSVPQSSAPSSSWSNQYSSHGGIDPMSVFQQDLRPSTAPDALGMWSDNASLSVPGPGSMLRR
jgi:hypothetical protein